ncbi:MULTISPECIES: hypothetical protein [Pseudomonas]|uniref:hypothetical protein n=1 Tax=Pseudomonas TaxID=286 RepID=UPI0019091380|nr:MULTISPECIES: hypothetical protein [unclassified Pseudomonas]MBK3433094.1 hypothetical protein [Pseudomonas fluorescens]MBK3483689.1 hypothetical protein [Pseudomonas fluorescens]MEB0191508.1 hypothetical protein [Pseudomonas sp. CCI1.1]WPX46142.1 hypothetical protein RHM69_17460 [Pseudomonas sp. CCI1.1]
MSTRQGIHEDTLQAMLEGGAVREALVSRHGDKWGLAIRLGGAGSRWLPVRSRREALRTWASLTAVGRFAEAVGKRGVPIKTSTYPARIG